MRITAGTHRGRTLKVPEGDAVRPTTDKVRQAIFNILQGYSYPVDAIVLDGFCGSGALGLEALSRGAAHVTFVEKQRDHMQHTQDNAAGMKVTDKCTFMLKDVTQIGPKPASAPPVTLVFLDPPYRMNLLAPALSALASGSWLASEACLVCEHENLAAPTLPPDFLLLDQRRYGDTQVSFIRYTSTP